MLKESWAEVWVGTMIMECILSWRSESFDVLSSLVTEIIVWVDSRFDSLIFFVSDISTEKELGEESLVLLSSSNSSYRECVNIVGWCIAWFPFLNEIIWLDVLIVVEDKSRLLKESWAEFWFETMLEEYFF